MIDRLVNTKVFNNINLKSGYWEILVRLGDVHKIAFKMRWGLFEYLVMPFGLTNAPAQIMSMMNDILGEYLERFALIFLDDILIYFANLQEHAEHVRKVLQVLHKQQLYAKASKCEIYKHSMEILRKQICGGSMTPIEAELKAVRDWSKPQNVRDIRSFLGYANYYRRFVKNFARVAGPLMDLTQKNVPYQWEPY